MADPLETFVNVATPAELVYKSSIALHTFVRDEFQSVTALKDEFVSLRNIALTIVEIVGILADQDEPWLDSDTQAVFALLQDSLRECNASLQYFQTVLNHIKRSRFTTQTLRQFSTKLELDLNSPQLDLLREQIVAHSNAMQLALQIVVL